MRPAHVARFAHAAMLAAIASAAHAAVMYNPVVTMIGDGAVPTSGQGKITTIRVYANTTANQVSPISELAYNSGATGTRLINSATAGSEGMLSNNPAIADAAAAGL